MNQWVRDALSYAEDNGNLLTYDEVANELTRAKIGGSYEKTMVQKMTTIRKISLAEAECISSITGFPLPASQEDVASLDDRLSRLSENRKLRLLEMLADLEAAEAIDRATEQLGRDSER